METANIYRQEAHKRGIEVTRPKKSGTKLAEEIGEGEIRAFSRLSIDSDNVLIDSLFTPSAYLEGINWEAVDVETREKWQEAKAVIDADDKGSFGANFLAHSEEMQGFFPEIKTAKNKYEREFKNLLRLLRFGMKKIEESEIQKRVHIVAFGHEDSMLEGLRINFGEESIGNCEMVTFGVEEGEIRGEFRGKEAVVE